MPPSQDSEFSVPDSMIVDPANPGIVDPLADEGIFLVALSKSGTERDAFLSLQLRILRKGSGSRHCCSLTGRRATSFNSLLLLWSEFRSVSIWPRVSRQERSADWSSMKSLIRSAAAAISHPHVVTIFAVEGTKEASLGTEWTTLPYLVMECIVGQTLHDKIKQVGALRVEEIIRISRQIVEGLAAAHKRGLIHCGNAWDSDHVEFGIFDHFEHQRISYHRHS
jgi:serine/threonine protein kinase